MPRLRYRLDKAPLRKSSSHRLDYGSNYKRGDLSAIRQRRHAREPDARLLLPLVLPNVEGHG